MRWPVIDNKTGNVIRWEEVQLNNNNTPFDPNRERTRQEEPIVAPKEREAIAPKMDKDVNLGVLTVVESNRAYWKNRQPNEK